MAYYRGKDIEKIKRQCNVRSNLRKKKYCKAAESFKAIPS